MSEVELRKVKATFGQHAFADKRQPTAYEVYLGGRSVGTVRSRSQESWEKSGRIRTRMRGFSRHWQATTSEGAVVGRLYYTRQAAIDALTEEHRD